MLTQAQFTDAVALLEATSGTVDFMAASLTEAVSTEAVDSTVADTGNELYA